MQDEARASRESTSVTGELLAQDIVNGLQSAMRVEARRNEADTKSGDGEIVYGVACSIPSSLIPSLSLSPRLGPFCVLPSL